MMGTMKLAPALVALSLVLVGCTSPATAPVPAVTVTATATVGPDEMVPSPTDTPTPTTDADGYILKNVGDQAALVGEDGTTYVRFKVTKIVPNFRCTDELADRSKHGHFIGIWMEVWTTKDVGGDDVNSFQTDDWQVIGPNGVTENDSDGNSDFCANDATSMPSSIDGAHHLRGVVVLDSKYTSGSLIFTAGANMQGGWKYSF